MYNQYNLKPIVIVESGKKQREVAKEITVGILAFVLAVGSFCYGSCVLWMYKDYVITPLMSTERVAQVKRLQEQQDAVVKPLSLPTAFALTGMSVAATVIVGGLLLKKLDEA